METLAVSSQHPLFASTNQNKWEVEYKGSGFANFTNVISDSSGNSFVIGTAWVENEPHGTSLGLVLRKYDNTGNLLFEKQFPTPKYRYYDHKLKIDTEGNLVAFGTRYHDDFRVYDIIKFDSKGNLLWETHSEPIDPSGEFINFFLGENQDYFLVGDARQNGLLLHVDRNGKKIKESSFDKKIGGFKLFLHDEEHVIRYDAKTLLVVGSLFKRTEYHVYAFTISLTDFSTKPFYGKEGTGRLGGAHSVAKGSDGEIYLAGELVGGGSLVMRLSKNGSVDWEKTYAEGEKAYSLYARYDTATHQLYFVGNRYLSNSLRPALITSQHDSKSGALLWERSFHYERGSIANKATQVLLTPEHTLLIAVNAGFTKARKVETGLFLLYDCNGTKLMENKYNGTSYWDIPVAMTIAKPGVFRWVSDSSYYHEGLGLHRGLLVSGEYPSSRQ